MDGRAFVTRRSEDCRDRRPAQRSSPVYLSPEIPAELPDTRPLASGDRACHGDRRYVHLGTGEKLDRSKTKALSASGVAIMQPKTNHFAWTKVETIVQVHGVGPWGINYVNPADDPRKK